VRDLLTVLFLFVSITCYSQGWDTIEVKFGKHVLWFASNKLVKVPDEYSDVTGNYLLDTMTVTVKGLGTIITKSPEPKCDFSLFIRNDSLYYTSGKWLPVKSSEFDYPEYNAFGQGIPHPDKYVFTTEFGDLSVKKMVLGRNYKLSTDSLKAVKEMYYRERKKPILFVEDKERLKSEFPDDSSWSTDIFYWCLLIAKANEDAEFERLILTDCFAYPEFKNINHSILISDIEAEVKENK
jgi:hypothetical protein